MKAWMVIVVVILLGAGAWYGFNRMQATPEPQPEPVVQPAPLPEPAPEPEPQPEPESQAVYEPLTAPSGRLEPIEPEGLEEPLPSLAKSDPLAMEVLGDLIGEDAVIRYLVNDAVIARAVATVDAMSSSQVPGNLMAVQGPQQEFVVEADEWPDEIILNEVGDPIPQFKAGVENERRYTAYVEMLEAIDPAQAVTLYRENQPLFQAAYAQLGYGSAQFEDRLLVIIDELLSAPDVDRPLQLQKPEAFYLFADPRLEALSAGQKMLLRMGQDNADRVKTWLRAFRAALEQA